VNYLNIFWFKKYAYLINLYQPLGKKKTLYKPIEFSNKKGLFSYNILYHKLDTVVWHG